MAEQKKNTRPGKLTFLGLPHVPGAKPLLNQLTCPGSARLLGLPSRNATSAAEKRARMLKGAGTGAQPNLFQMGFVSASTSRPKMGAPGRGRGAKVSPAVAPHTLASSRPSTTPASSRPSTAPGGSGEPSPPKQTTTAPGTAPTPEKVIPIPSDPSLEDRDGGGAGGAEAESEPRQMDLESLIRPSGGRPSEHSAQNIIDILMRRVWDRPHQQFDAMKKATDDFLVKHLSTLKEHEVLHDELNTQNKALLLRVRELVNAGDAKENRIRELEAQVRNQKEAVPKEEFIKMKSTLAELNKKYDDLALEKSRLAEELQQKSQDLESSNRNREELDLTITNLQGDLDDLAKDSQILNKELLEPLGYPLFNTDRSEDQTFKLAGAVAQGLIQACRNTCEAIGIKKSDRCSVPRLLKRMQEASKFIIDKQRSSARGAARTTLALIHAHHPDLDLEYCTAGAPEECDQNVVFAQVQGLDNRIVRMVDHGTYYDKQKLTPVNLKRERARLRKEEAARLKEADAGEKEDTEQPSEEAEESEEKSSQDPDDDAAHDGSEATASSPDQASPHESDVQED